MNAVTSSSTQEIPAKIFSQMANTRIYFGHQSVGINILRGVERLYSQTPSATLNIEEFSGTIPVTKGFLLHSKIGKNTDPISKLNAFADQCIALKDANLHWAMMKFCYIDFNAQTVQAQIQKTYLDVFAELKKQCPNTGFIHITAPYTAVRYGVRSIIKKILGQPTEREQENIARNQFNDFLRSHFTQEPLFDLAALEATDPQNNPVTFQCGGKKYQTLFPGYTNDGGHLNEDAQMYIAAKLIQFIGDLPSPISPKDPTR